MNCLGPTGRFEQRRLLEVWRAGRPELQEQLLDRDRRRMFEPVHRDSGPRFQVFGMKQVGQRQGF